MSEPAGCGFATPSKACVHLSAGDTTENPRFVAVAGDFLKSVNRE
jgi:hypothetical protein